VGDKLQESRASASSPGDVSFGRAMTACLRAQQDREPRTWLEKLRGVSPLSPEASEFYAAGVGELEASVALAALGAEWFIAGSIDEHDPSVGADYVVLGPAGVFAVCSRRHPGAKAVTAGRMILIQGHRVAYVRDATVLAERLTESFAALGAPSVEARPLVTLTGVSELVRGRMRAPVPVLPLQELAAWLIRHETIYSRAEVAALVPVAGRLAEWSARPAVTGPSVRLTARFERLRVEVDAARRRFRRWIVLGGVVALAATAAVVSFALPAIATLFLE